jgi:KaiC/GvpD/RAD55 family RecA-like ATPase
MRGEGQALRLERVSTGVEGLDEVLGGGIPAKSIWARTLTYDLAVQMASWGATTLLVGEYAAADAGQLPEFAIADGIVRLGTAPHDLTRIRELEIQKLRGSGFVPGIHVQLRYVELADRLDRAVSIIKARGVDVDTEVRGMTI